MVQKITLSALTGIPMIEPGMSLGGVIADSLQETSLEAHSGDVLVVAQKIVSKSEGRIVDLGTIIPGEQAIVLAEETGKDPRQVELILSESKAILRKKHGTIIVEHKRGWIMANAGIDASNVAPEDGSEKVLLLPEDPDVSAENLRQELAEITGLHFGIVISDRFGRPWRIGTTGVALGAAGVASLWDRRGDTDLFGRVLKVSQLAVADELATAASLVQGQADEGQPVVLVQGCAYATNQPARPAAELIRPAQEDMFR